MNDKISFEEAMRFADFDKHFLRRRDNAMLLSDYQVEVLNRNGINYLDYSNIHDLLYEIENALDDFFDDELDYVGSQLSELIYYKDTKK